MDSEKRPIHRDIFGDDDEEEDDHIQNDDRDYDDRAGSNNRDDGREGSDKDDTAPEGGHIEEEEDEGIPLPSFKKRHADGESPAPESRKKKTTKKPKPASGAAGEGSQNGEGGEDLPLDPRQQALMKLERDFEAALKSGKTSTRRRRKDEEDIDQELDKDASRFIERMREAVFADIDSKVKRQPALAKVSMLESVKKQLNKSHLHNIFLDNGILEVMKLWLEPLQDASLPSLDIIQDFLDLLDVLPIQTLQLANSGVGRVVYFYTKVDDSRVTPSIKRKAHSLVDKWSRPIVKLSEDYKKREINYAEESPVSSSSQRRRPAGGSSGTEAPGPATLGVRVPQIDRGSYAYMPQSSITYDKSRGGKSDKYKKLKSHMAKMKQVKRT